MFHKFKYSPERYGMLGCVGCGRCVAVCPVNIDIRKVIERPDTCRLDDLGNGVRLFDV